MVVLENELLRVEINPFGAELSSLVLKSTGHEYLWQGQNPWNRRAPILFPIVGRLKHNQYNWEGVTYNLGQHGFARESQFDVVYQDGQRATFALSSTIESEKAYPFKFKFEIEFALETNALLQTFKVTNLSNTRMPVSFGAHPAFNTKPLNNFSIKFEKSESELSDTVIDGIRNGQMRDIIQDNQIALTQHLFDNDALIYRNLESKSLSILNNNSPYLNIEFPNFTHLGIWAKPSADFVCIEPWMGVADAEEHAGNIEEKEGIILLEANAFVSRTMFIEIP